MIYMEKFTRFFDEPDVTEDWIKTWGEEFHDLTGEEIRHGLSVLAKDHPWPPTMEEFRACCKSGSIPYKPLLEATKHGNSPHAEACMAKIREILAKPKPDPRAWKQEVLDRASLGHRVSMAAMELARK